MVVEIELRHINDNAEISISATTMKRRT